MNTTLIIIGVIVFIVIINSANVALASGLESTKDRIIMFLHALSMYIIVPAVLYSGVSVLAGEIDVISVICIIFVIIFIMSTRRMG